MGKHEGRLRSSNKNGAMSRVTGVAYQQPLLSILKSPHPAHVDILMLGRRPGWTGHVCMFVWLMFMLQMIDGLDENKRGIFGGTLLGWHFLFISFPFLLPRSCRYLCLDPALVATLSQIPHSHIEMSAISSLFHSTGVVVDARRDGEGPPAPAYKIQRNPWCAMCPDGHAGCSWAYSPLSPVVRGSASCYSPALTTLYSLSTSGMCS